MSIPGRWAVVLGEDLGKVRHSALKCVHALPVEENLVRKGLNLFNGVQKLSGSFTVQR